ncbi:MAG: NAD-dependent epimerase/dehydratase family protein [Deltaproteobacteria bacterium]|nr:NAD-dependent epimerase/dehydratase family protein [Deltaproteobacteria bacterium]
MALNEEAFQGKRVLVTGGLGFIGSNLSIRLMELGARVTIVDNMMPRLGGNLFNVKAILDQIQINFSDVRDEHSMDYLVKDQDFIFHLAGQVNHVDSIRNPIQDLDINCRGTLVLLESCRKYNREVKVIFSGTRGEYGASVKLPVGEDHPTNPKGIYAVTNLSAEKMVLVYDDVHKISGTCLRITNTYGPRHQMAHDEYGVFNWFIRKAIDDEVIPVFGDGHILRDFLYVDDLVDCFLQVAACPTAFGEVFNVGTGVPISFIDLAKKIVEVAGSGKVAFTEFTKERKEVEPGDYYTDISKVRKVVGWAPKISLEEGLRKTVKFYRKYKGEYWG